MQTDKARAIVLGVFGGMLMANFVSSTIRKTSCLKPNKSFNSASSKTLQGLGRDMSHCKENQEDIFAINDTMTLNVSGYMQ